jgi:hypothetical protein
VLLLPAASEGITRKTLPVRPEIALARPPTADVLLTVSLYRTFVQDFAGWLASGLVSTP